MPKMFIFEQCPTEVESNESLFFDPSSPFFQQILYASLGVLGLFLVCGVLYQVLYFKRRMHLERWYLPFLAKLTFNSKTKVIQIYLFIIRHRIISRPFAR